MKKYKEELNSDIWAEKSYWESLDYSINSMNVITDPIRTYIFHWPTKKVSLTITAAYIAIDNRFDFGYSCSCGKGGGFSPIINEEAEPGQKLLIHPAEATMWAIEVCLTKYILNCPEAVAAITPTLEMLKQWCKENLQPKPEPPKFKPGFRERYRRKKKVKRWINNLEQMDPADKQAILTEIAHKFFGVKKGKQQTINFTEIHNNQLQISF